MRLPSRYPQRLAGAAALACAAALTPAAAIAAASAQASAPAAGPACATAGLVIWMTPDGAAAGSAYYTLNFTNLSGHTCTLKGHPGVSAVSLGGHRLGSAASWAPPAAQAVTLANGATGYALLQYSDVITGGGGPQPCNPATAAGLRVYPPGQSTAKTVPIPLTACTTSGLVYMNVRSLQQTPPPS